MTEPLTLPRGFQAAALAATRPEHVRWVDLHRGPAFSEWVRWLGTELDAHEPQDAQEHALVERFFARAVDCELAFFDAA